MLMGNTMTYEDYLRTQAENGSYGVAIITAENALRIADWIEQSRDWEEVVHCRYCKWSKSANDYQDGYYCKHPHHNKEYLVFSRHYCSYGQLKEAEET